MHATVKSRRNIIIKGGVGKQNPFGFKINVHTHLLYNLSKVCISLACLPDACLCYSKLDDDDDDDDGHVLLFNVIYIRRYISHKFILYL